MTWSMGLDRAAAGLSGLSGVFGARAWLCVAIAATAGCSCDSDGSSRELTVTDPAADAVLTRADDTDAEAAGVQYDVVVAAEGLSDGTEVELYIGSDSEMADEAEVEDGQVTFAGVTLTPGVQAIYARTASGLQSSEDQQYTLRALEIVSPDPGPQLLDESQADDFQLTIEVAAFAVEDGISIRVDGETVGEPEDANDMGTAAFVIDLAYGGEYTIDAVAGDITSEPISVQIGPLGGRGITVRCDNIDLVTPEVPSGDTSITLGGDDCPSDETFSVDVTLSTDAGNGNMATLTVNGQNTYTASVDGTLVTFEDVVLDRRRDRANRLSVRIDTGDDMECSRDFDIDFFVDCAGPGCSIESPLPVSYDENGDTLNFLGGEAGDGTEFDIEVGTDETAVGQTVQLIIDGNSRTPIEVTAVEDGAGGRAVFANVELPEGSHTVEAQCVDGNDNITYSAVAEWIVDVSPCAVAFDSPTEGAILGPNDDADGNADGLQIDVDLDLSDEDCVFAGVEICDPSQDIAPALTGYDGQSDLSVTLQEGEAMQDICVALVDRAGNTGTGSIGVTVIEAAPMATILSPADGARFNALGNDASGQDYEPDSDANTDTCEADVRVECTVIGTDVELLRGAAGSETVVATEPCAMPGSGDTDVTAGAGIAVFSDVDFLGGASVADGARLVARQTLTATSGDLVGESAAIDITGDCAPPDAPASVLVTDAGGMTIGTCPAFVLEAGSAAATDSQVVVTSDAVGATLTVTRVGSSSAEAPVTLTKAAADPEFVFSGVQLGDGTAGMATIDVAVIDGFNNEATAASCQLTSELIEITAPADGTRLSRSDSGCPPGPPLRASVSATLPSIYPDGTLVRVLASGGGAASQQSSGGAISNVCVPLVVGPQTLTVTLPDGASATVDVEAASEESPATLALTGLTFQAPDPDQPATSDSYRSDPLSVTWDALPSPTTGSIFWASYEMRCARTDVFAGNPQNWWDNATPQPLTATVADTSDTLAWPTGLERYCVLRACDDINRCTAIPTAGALADKPYRRQLVLPPAPAGADSPNWFGSNIVPVGDVNGDGLSDMLVAGGNPEAIVVPGGTGTSQVFLYFGRDVSPTDDGSAGTADAPDVVFTKARDFAEATPFGSRLAGLGDVNGDGIDDFAIAAPTNCDGIGCSDFSLLNSGAVFIFFGRAAGDPWPSSLDVAPVTDPGPPAVVGCGADICLRGADRQFFGAGLAGLGAFDPDDGVPDLAIGASVAGADGVGAVYVLSGDSLNDITCGALGTPQAAPCARPGGQDVWGVDRAFPTDLADFNGFVVEGTAANNNGTLGGNVTAVGNADGAAGNDVVVTDRGTSAIGPAMGLLSGRSFGAGVTALDVTSEVTSILTPPASTGDEFGFTVVALGNVWDAPGTPAGTSDLGVYTDGIPGLTVYPGTGAAGGFDGNQSITLGNDGAGALGRWTASGSIPALGLDGASGQLDLDGDGTADVVLGARSSASGIPGATGQGEVYVAPGAALQSLPAAAVFQTYDRVSPPVFAVDTRGRAVSYLGDVTGDGEPDLAVGDFPAGIIPGTSPEDITTVQQPNFPREGALWILY